MNPQTARHDRHLDLRAAIARATHYATSGGHSIVISNPIDPDREIRFTFPRPPPDYLGGTLVVEERRTGEPDWRPFKGFTLDDVQSIAWRVHSACGQPCGKVAWGKHQSPGNAGCTNK